MDTIDQVTLNILLTTDVVDNRPVYLTGNFNNWRLCDKRFKMKQLAEGQYHLKFPKNFDYTFPLEYKYSKGSWDAVELDEHGDLTDNRVLTKVKDTVEDHVPYWLNNGNPYQEQFLPKITLISEEFEMPQLVKTRRIAALLPYDYDQSDRHYPVLYLQDGQNLFDDYAPYGNWGVDKKLAMMAEAGRHDIIIIAIDHAEAERLSEFTPTTKTRLGIGQGKKYARFLADTLKPYVDKHFRTLPDQKHTGIGGSSMGGLISIYAGFMYPEVYSKLLIFSPSLWVNPRIKMNSFHFDDQLETKIYLYGGAKESAHMVPNIKRFRDTLFQSGSGDVNLEFHLSIDPEGEHNEQRWGKEFPKAIHWLFF